VEKLQELRAGCVGAIADVDELSDQVPPIVRSKFAGAEINGSVVAIEQERVSIEAVCGY
jgi:hypothetical protein